MIDLHDYSKIADLDAAVESGLKEEEFIRIKELCGREINMLELGVFSALYSEHCSYKSTKVHLKTLPTEGERVLQGPGENAGIIDIGDGKAVAFKVESHNHPTFIEPFQGAATGVGGILRDVFTMGARPLICMNALRFGDVKEERTSYLLANSVAGIGTYGNCVGIPTLGGELDFHSSYNGNCLVNAFALGLVDSDRIFRGLASGAGNTILYIGSKTGRDGIHGATMASEEFDESSEQKRPTVQVGDPFQEKLLLEACLEIMATDSLVGIQDMGAAGLTSSAYEMASRAGSGVRIYLDRVPQREEGMTPYELMLSESQERMLLVVKKGQEDTVVEICKKWDLDAVAIGEVIEGGYVELFWHGDLISSLPVDVVVDNSPEYRWPEKEPAGYRQTIEFNCLDINEPEDLNGIWLSMLSSLSLCSRYPVYRQYDSTVRSNTVIHPGGDAAVIRIKDKAGTIERGVSSVLDCNSRYCAIDPRAGAAHTVVEGYRNTISCGAVPVGISDCLNFGSPERPEVMWQIAEAVRGMGEACRALKIPVVSGNVSLYNETQGAAIMPTPLVATVGLAKDVSNVVKSHFRGEGDRIFFIGETFEELGGSEYLAHMTGVEKGKLPVLDYSLEINTGNFILKLIDERLITSCHDVSGGGLAIALAECCFTPYSKVGAAVEVWQGASVRGGGVSVRKDSLLFSESGARYIISLAPDNEERVREIARDMDVKITGSGEVGGDKITVEGYAGLDLKEAYLAWSSGLNKLI